MAIKAEPFANSMAGEVVNRNSPLESVITLVSVRGGTPQLGFGHAGVDSKSSV
jgi:hypothetical protein